MKFRSNYQKYLDENKITYQEYLESSHWQEKKKEFKNSGYYRGCCWACGAKKYLHLHHKSYDRIGKEHLGDFVELCSNCHTQVHQKIKSESWSLLEAHRLLRKTKIEKPKKKKRGKRGKRKCPWPKKQYCKVCHRWVGNKKSKDGYCSLCRPQPYTLV